MLSIKRLTADQLAQEQQITGPSQVQGLRRPRAPKMPSTPNVGALKPRIPPPSPPREVTPTTAPAIPPTAGITPKRPVAPAPVPASNVVPTTAPPPTTTATGFANIPVTGPGERATRVGPTAWSPIGSNLGIGPNTGADLQGLGGLQPLPPPPPASQEQLDQTISRLMEDLISGKGMKADTAAEEALIKELMQDRLGQGLVEQRARMGRAGFGASGALAAMEGDIRRQAGQQATQETLALRRQAEQEAINNALRGVEAEMGTRKEGRAAIFDQEFLNALRSAMAQNEPGGDIPGLASGVAESVTSLPEKAAKFLGIPQLMSDISGVYHDFLG